MTHLSSYESFDWLYIELLLIQDPIWKHMLHSRNLSFNSTILQYNQVHLQNLSYYKIQLTTHIAPDLKIHSPSTENWARKRQINHHPHAEKFSRMKQYFSLRFSQTLTKSSAF